MALDVPRGTLYKWKTGRNLPHLNWLLQLCCLMKVRLIDILCREVTIDEAAESIIRLESAVAKQNGYKQRYNLIDHDRTEKLLLVALNEFPPQSLKQVALQIGYSSFRLKVRFPQLCKTISTRYKHHITTPFDLEKARRIIRAATKESPPPSLERVYRRLGVVGQPDQLHKHFPKESRIILERYKASRMRPFDLDRITTELKAALNEWPPCSKKRFAERNNINPRVVFKKLPQLCKELSEKYRIYCKQMRAEKHETIRKEARRVGIELHSKRQYPSAERIQANFTILGIEWIIRQVSKELLRELGYV
ncbi:MAG: hypothetical protein QOH63_3809 [Acidobacteriota bacterium]|nr:hypothetical protein [Acidobacteriota bacterium]